MECIVCSNPIKEENFIEEYFSDITKIKYKLYICNKCGVGFFEPRKLDPILYEEEAFDAYALFHLGLRSLYSNHKMFFKYFPAISGNLRLLDVGCAEGIFIKEVNKKFPNIEVYGIDFDKKSIQVAKEKFGLKNVYPFSLEEFYDYAVNRNLKFDIITFFEVLEHQTDPNKFLDICRKLLNTNGYIAGSVPNSKSIFKGLGGYPPHHFLWFNKDSLYNVLKINGFKDIEVYFVEQSIKEKASVAQALIMGNLGLKLRSFVIKKLLKYDAVENKIPVNKYTANYLFGNDMRIKIFKLIKPIRDFSFLPLAIFLNPFLKNGLYFQCRIR
jgi:2-polyprenyl-3-methyl-5-hydroxy-6-metoxy-1,4-benzoquinol methylase